MRVSPLRINKLNLTGKMYPFKKYFEKIETLELTLGMCPDYTRVYWLEKITEMQELQDELEYLNQSYYLNEINEDYFLMRSFEIEQSLENTEGIKQEMLNCIEYLEEMLLKSQE